MGSTGSGSFGNYDIGGNKPGLKNSNGGGEGKESNCPEIIENIILEDVGLSEYYTKRSSVPPKSTPVEIRRVVNGRIVAQLTTGEVIGNIPTQYNFLLNCIQGMSYYSGNVISSGLEPIPFIVITINHV
jgi:hypothetical protein